MGPLFLLVALVVLSFLAFALYKGRVSEKTVELMVKGLIVLGALGLALFAASMILRFWVGFLIVAVIAGALAIGQSLSKGGGGSWRGKDRH